MMDNARLTEAREIIAALLRAGDLDFHASTGHMIEDCPGCAAERARAWLEANE